MKFGIRARPEESIARSGSSEEAVSAENGEGEAAGTQAPPVGEPEAGGVAGERGTASVNRARSLQSRLSNVLAAGLMCALGLGALTWYYAHVFARSAHAAQVAQRAAGRAASGDAPLPPLGPFSMPHATASTAPAASSPTLAQQILGPPPELPSPAATAAWDQANEMARFNAVTQPPPAATAAQPRVSALDRKLQGPVFAASSGLGSSADGAASVRPMSNEFSGSPWAMPPSSERSETSLPAAGESLATLLRPSVTPAVEASVLPTERFLLPKGGFIDCTLETAIDSTLPGMTTCITATDTFGADGTVVLLERGTKLVGETRGQVREGQARLFVLWTEARTPTGVIVPLDSPGTDALGRAGLTGKVNTHFWERFGAAILVSVIDAGVQAGIQSTNNGGTVIVSPSSTEDVMTGILRSTINIPPTITVRQGARIQVLVARDVDFRSVYRLTLTRSIPVVGVSP
jgi:type IV secretion system protein VirB10